MRGEEITAAGGRADEPRRMTRAEAGALGAARSALSREEGLAFARAWRDRASRELEAPRATTAPYPFRDHPNMAEFDPHRSAA